MTTNTHSTHDSLSDLSREIGIGLIVIIYVEIVCSDVFSIWSN
jgi:hypothetical protein